MAQHTSAVLLTDGAGQPIPQYLDTADKTDSPQGTFKPLTKNQPVQLAGISIPGGLPVDLQGASISADSLSIENVQFKTQEVTFHDAVTAAGEGTPFTVGAYKTLTVELYGSSAAREIKFYGVSASGIKRSIQGINLQSLTFASSTTGTGEIWSFEITGLETVIVEVVSVTGGAVMVKGKAVA
ncbi:hypothetical protein [Domibacillus aminovorans]|uniref:Uncharacterized protein n=1 Tax=Domibacillus aminovorans TaxID=29332 RepID=A0A177L9U3_9BACI|nr:hypothetical protein [Domibacillus aminovorans]OAH61945.1 hypothetical protein AWH49_11010 [Domibacillus aminovorans]